MNKDTYRSGLTTRKSNISDSYNPISLLHTDINNLFDDFFNFKMPKLRSESNYQLLLPVEIIESKKSFKINAELVGIDKKDVDIIVSDSDISIKCKREETIKKEEETYLVRETHYGSFERRIKVPENADTKSAKASFKDGILSISIDKKPDSINKERKLEIS